MTNYVNCCGIDLVDDLDGYTMIAQQNTVNMLRIICGLEKDASLDDVDLAAGAENSLLEHGIAAETVLKPKNNMKLALKTDESLGDVKTLDIAGFLKNAVPVWFYCTASAKSGTPVTRPATARHSKAR